MARQTGRGGLEFDPATLDLLESYDWPGNVRELENVIERMVVLSRSDRLVPDGVPSGIRSTGESMAGARFWLPPEGVNLEELEIDLIRQALEREDGNQTRAAKRLGLTRNTLLYRMQKYRLR
jgi:DNA-binding NtrC family response regulator